MGKRSASPLAIVGILIYTFLVGADAAVMGMIWVIAIWVGRPGLALNSLIFSGFVLTLLNPLILGDVGFQLSFIATLARPDRLSHYLSTARLSSAPLGSGCGWKRRGDLIEKTSRTTLIF